MEFIIWYLVIGGLVSSILLTLATQHPLYKATVIGWIVITFVWPYALVRFIWRLIRG